MARLRLVALPAVSIVLAAAASGAIVQVDTTSDELIVNDDCSLREAILAANFDTAVGGCAAGSGFDDILIPAGTYVLTIAGAGEDDDFTGDLDVRSSLTLIGAGADQTVIDASLLGDRVLHVQPPFGGPDLAVEIWDLTLRGGFLDEDAGNPSGCIEGGGGLFVRGPLAGAPFDVATIIDGCVIEDNTAGTGGGVSLRVADAGTMIRHTVIRGNTATGGTTGPCGGTGGGVHGQAEGVFLLDSEVEANVAEAPGPAFEPERSAGGIYAAGSLTIRRSAISENHSDAGTGGMLVFYGSLSIGNATISGNSSDGPTGGLSLGHSFFLPPYTSSIFATVAENSGTEVGGIRAQAGATVDIGATLVAGNLGGTNADVDGAFSSGDDNLIGDGGTSSGFTGPNDQVGTTASPVDPLLGALADNGGASRTHALLAGSPAIDAAACLGVIQDQRAEPRPVGADCDIGAFELPEPGQLGGLAPSLATLALLDRARTRRSRGREAGCES